MTFQQLQNAVSRLAIDPRTHPNTPVEFDHSGPTSDGDVMAFHDELVAIHVENAPRRIVFTDRATSVDVAR